jgi:hypothetical protein
MPTIRHVEDATIAEWERRGLLKPLAPAPMPIVDDQAAEKDFQAEVVKFAKRNGWKAFHVHDSRKSEKGWPDLVLVRERILFAELKSETGTTTPDQDDWLEALRRAGAEVYLWRPRDWPVIAATLEKFAPGVVAQVDPSESPENQARPEDRTSSCEKTRANSA